MTSDFTQQQQKQARLAERECAAYDACENAVEPVDAGRPQTHAGTAARRRAFRELRLRSQAQEDNRLAKIQAARQVEADEAAAKAAAAEVLGEAPETAPAEPGGPGAGSDDDAPDVEEEGEEAPSAPDVDAATELLED